MWRLRLNMDNHISLGDAERKFFLGVYRSAVAAYQPRIEKKTGVALGDISVWDYSQMREHVLMQGLPIIRRLRRFVFSRRLRRQAENLRVVCEESATKCSAAYYRNGIYVSFSSGTAHEEVVAAAVVHELAHALWERLARKPLTWRPKRQFWGKYKLFAEGFATYAETIWFLDLYPIAVKRAVQGAYIDPQGVHYRGMCQIEDLVRKHGQQILFEIPKRWQSM